MDPIAVLRRIMIATEGQACTVGGDLEECTEISDACETLDRWMDRGGFAPDVPRTPVDRRRLRALLREGTIPRELAALALGGSAAAWIAIEAIEADPTFGQR